MNFINHLKSYFLEAFSNKAIVDGLKQALSLLILIMAIICVAGFFVFIVVLSTIYNIEINEDFIVTLMFFTFFSPFFIYLLYLLINKKERIELIGKVKGFIVSVFAVIKIFFYLFLILGGIILFFIIAGAVFSWLIGLGVATLLVIVIIILLLK